uniref:Leucine-rich repeat flightless-interacting protein 2 n=1 Tax=Cacopsylla melanoneura TaxID=428564 RepID=A0A8D9B746_9HEMI
MKSVKVKKSPAILGLSKKSKDKLKNKKKPKDLSTSLRNVLAKHFSEDHSDSDPSVLKDNVKIVNKKPNQQGKSPKKGKQSMKQKKGKNKTDSLVKIETEDRKPVVLQKVDYIDSKKAIVAVQALLNHVKTQNKNILFKSEGTPIFAQFDTVAIPKHPKTTLRFVLPHSPHSKVSDVLLIITDEKKHHRKLRHDDEMYIVNFEEKLKELGVKGVNKVMTLRQIRAEYYTHEMRRKLSDMYDVFLVDGKIGCKLSSLIGKCFYAKNKTPIPVSLENEDKVKLEVERALRKTQLVFKSSCCTNSVVRIGHTDMSPKELSENLEAFSKAVDTSKYPGGWRNVKKVHIKTPTSIALPVYFSFVTPNEIENAELKHTLPKHCVAVKGELSTIGRDVTVKPDGSIEVEGVDDIKSLMHQLYKHAGFKDHEDLDLTNAEYKELVKELRKNIPLKKEPEDPNEPTEADVEDLLDNDDDEDDDTAEARLQAKRQARAEAREIRLREIERQQKEAEENADRAFDVMSDTMKTVKISAAVPSPRALSLTLMSRRSSEDSLEGGETSQAYRDMRMELKELEEKFRKAMVQNAQLDNEKCTATYEVELLKDRFEELEESHSSLNKEHREKCRELDQLKRVYKKMEEDLAWYKSQLEERDRLIEENGLVIVGGEQSSTSSDSGAEDSSLTLTNRKEPKRALVSASTAQLLNLTGEGSLDVRLKKIADERNNLLDELSHAKLELDALRAVTTNGVGNPLTESEEEMKEASKLLGDYKFKWQKAEQDVSTLQATVARLESQVIRYKSAAETSEKVEDELKVERRKLQRELREALARLEELETSNTHLQRRLDKLKNAKSNLLKDL